METVAERLRKALEISGLSQGKLLLRLKDEKAVGRSRPSLQAYLRGERGPPVEYMEVVAKICGVRPAWLICGDGAPTEEAEARRKFEGMTVPGAPADASVECPSRQGLS